MATGDKDFKSLLEFRLIWSIDTSASPAPVAISSDLLLNEVVELTNTSTMIAYNSNNIEIFTWTCTGWVWTITKRWLWLWDTEVEISTLRKPWDPWTKVRVVLWAFDILHKSFCKPTRIDIPQVTDDTARWVLYTDTTWAHIVVNLTHNAVEWYNPWTWTWNIFGASTSVNNASETVKGIAEQWTQTETDTWSETGGTLAKLFSTPQEIGRSVQKQSWTYDEDTWAADAYVITLAPVPLAYTEWMEIVVKIWAGNTNTGACTIDVNSLWAKNIKRRDGSDPSAWDLTAAKFYRLRYDGTNFTIQESLIATTTQAGTVELLTDAEFKTGSDETKYANAKQIKDNCEIKQEIVTFTFAGNASGAVNISHNLWVVPKLIIFSASTQITSGSNSFAVSNWAYDGTNNKCTYMKPDIGGDWTSNNDATKCIRINYIDWALTDLLTTWAVTGATTTNFTITYANTNWDAGDTIYANAILIWQYQS